MRKTLTMVGVGWALLATAAIAQQVPGEAVPEERTLKVTQLIELQKAQTAAIRELSEQLKALQARVTALDGKRPAESPR